MSTSTVKTCQILDPRIEPQPNPIYSMVVGPRQNQFYKIPASGLSNSYITFNNLTTLGVDRAYLDTFELEITAQIVFHGNAAGAYKPDTDEWTFESFPFNKCCEEARVNINGGAFFSSPLSYLRAKERYWDEKLISESYENICPCHKPHLQNEIGCFCDRAVTPQEAIFTQHLYDVSQNPQTQAITVTSGLALPTRLPAGQTYFMQTPGGLSGTNNSIIRGGALSPDQTPRYQWDQTGQTLTVTVTWREPVFCSPFSSRIDATYGRPLYNITSMDLAFNLQGLGNMIRVAHLRGANYVNSYDITIQECQLCYQVMTIPPSFVKPLNTLVPYRKFTPYITDYPYNRGRLDPAGTDMRPSGGLIHMTSGVYTMNEIPQAIWIFCAPTKRIYQTNPPDNFQTGQAGDSPDTNILYAGNWISNKQFGYIRKLSITMANTTQILNTADIPDLYRIAKANGCCDSFETWGVPDASKMRTAFANSPLTVMPVGVGSVLRLVPGVDIIIPDQTLIPAANANNMVFQVEADFYVPPHSPDTNEYALWLLFEYVGVAAISPGQCEITMNPIGTGEIMAASPLVTATSAATEGQLEGSGWLDMLKRALSWAAQKIKSSGLGNSVLDALTRDGLTWDEKKRMITDKLKDTVGLDTTAPPLPPRPSRTGGGPLAKIARKTGGAMSGGAVMGLGDFC